MHQKDKDREKLNYPLPSILEMLQINWKGRSSLTWEKIIFYIEHCRGENSRALVTHSDEPVAPAAPTAAPAQIGDHL